jgi:hypothetical protein
MRPYFLLLTKYNSFADFLCLTNYYYYVLPIIIIIIIIIIIHMSIIIALVYLTSDFSALSLFCNYLFHINLNTSCIHVLELQFCIIS